jgi:hypothetical protein
MIMMSAIKTTIAKGKQMFVDSVIWSFGIRKRKILNKWRNENDGKIRKIGTYLFC